MSKRSEKEGARKICNVVTVTMVRNEADIVEVFIRYHVPIVDRMIILDNDSSDGTRDVLVRLQQEGLPIDILWDARVSFDQSEVISQLATLAFQRHRPQYIVPLDVDEFITRSEGPITREWFNELPKDAVALLQWRTYVPTHGIKWGTNPLLEITTRHQAEPTHDLNVIMPALVFAAGPPRVHQGNHSVSLEDGGAIVHQCVPAFVLSHFPIRSCIQCRKKYVIGWLANLCREESVVFDWASYYTLLKNSEHEGDDLLRDMAGRYNVIDKASAITTVEDPLDTSHVGDFEMRYFTLPRSALECTLDYAESLALEVARARPKWRREAGLALGEHYSQQLTLNSIRDFYTFPGWLSTREALALYRGVRSVGVESPTVVELGTWWGRSAYVLAKAIQEIGGGELHCVDPFDYGGDLPSSEKYYSYGSNHHPTPAEVRQRLVGYGLDDLVQVHVSPSVELAACWQKKVDFLFVDANHEYSHVRADFHAWERHLSPGALIALHDVGSATHYGPQRIVEEELLHSAEWEQVLFVDELFIAKRRAD